MKDDILKQFRDQVPDPVHSRLIEGLEPPVLPPHDNAKPPIRLNRVAIGLAGLSALAIAFVAVLASGGSEKSATPILSIPKPLATASAAAARPAPEGIQYTRTKVISLGTTGNPPYSWHEPRIYEAWIRDDGSGRLRTTELSAEWPGPRDQARAVAANDQHTLELTDPGQKEVVQDADLSSDEIDQSFGGGSFPPAEGLSSDPAELRDQLEAFLSGDGPESVQLFELACDVLLKPNVDGPVRAAAFEVIGQLPGVVIDRTAADPLGRPTVSASITSAATGAESTKAVYFDSQSSRVFAYTDTLTEPEDFIDSRLLASVVLTDDRTVSSVP